MAHEEAGPSGFGAFQKAAMALPAPYSHILSDPEFLEIKAEATRLIVEWLVRYPSVTERPPSQLVDGRGLNEFAMMRFSARHEAGHILMLWFSDTKVDVAYSTILRPADRKAIPGGAPLQRFKYKDLKPFLKDSFENRRRYFFDSICLYMGGIRCEQRHYPKVKLHQCQRDIHCLCIKAFRLAHLTPMDFPRPMTIKDMAILYIKAAFDIASELLVEKRDLFIKLESCLSKHKFLFRNEIVKILGRRPKQGVDFYGKFLLNTLRNLHPQPFLIQAPVMSFTKPEGEQENVALEDSSPKIYTQL